MQYDFLAPGRILFGWGRRRELHDLVRGIGQRAFLLAGARALEQDRIIASLQESLLAAGFPAKVVGHPSGEPTVSSVDNLTQELRGMGAGAGDFLIAVGGGSTIDLGKAVSAMLTNADGCVSVSEFLEGAGQTRKVVHAPLPLVAIPTTGGTGAEATKNAVIASSNPAFKRSLRSDGMMPRAVLIDPELCVSVPPDVTAWTGMDAITQCIESYVSKRAQPIPQALALEGLRKAVVALPVAVREGGNRAAREALSHAAFLSGMALANSGLGLAHGVAAGLGARHGVPHGLACAVMLPVAMRFNLPARTAELAVIGRTITGKALGSDEADAEAGIAAIEELADGIAIPRKVSELGVQREHIAELAKASHGNSLNGNPREISDTELCDLLEGLL